MKALLRATRTALAGILATSAAHAAIAYAPTDDPCTVTARAARQAKRAEAFSELSLALGICANTSDPDERAECEREAFADFFETRALAEEQHDARLSLCAALGGGPYDPPVDPEQFSARIDNPFLPFVPGTTLRYEKTTAEGKREVSVVRVLRETREILGVECLVVRDTETVDGERAEDTFDYYAQDRRGNVWYFGELSMSFEDGYLASLGGSWLAGEDGARPGILMPAAPRVGDSYRQEFLLAEAEDAATVLALDARVSVPYGDFDDCLETLDFTPIEPGNVEHKFYAAGIGLVLATDPGNGERLELVSVMTE